MLTNRAKAAVRQRVEAALAKSDELTRRAARHRAALLRFSFGRKVNQKSGPPKIGRPTFFILVRLSNSNQRLR